jgi:hypothetical protein
MMSAKTILMRILKAVVILEATYLVLVNLTLSLSVTQTMINQVKPEKFTVYWDKTWT